MSNGLVQRRMAANIGGRPRVGRSRADGTPRGSLFRGGADVVACGPTDGNTSIASGASATLTFDIIEDMTLEHLVLIGPAISELLVTDIRIDNNGVVSGQVPATMFAADCVVPPAFGFAVNNRSTVQVTLENFGAAAAVVAGAFTAAEANDALPGGGVRGSLYRGGADIVACGPTDGNVSISAGASAVLTFNIIEDMTLEHLIITGPDTNELLVNSIVIDNDGTVSGQIPAALYRRDSQVMPAFGHFVTNRSTVQVTIENLDGTNAAVVSAGFTAAEAA